MRVSHAMDNRLLLAGVAAALALVVYLAVAFANTHASNSAAASSSGDPFAPWVPKYHSTLALVPGRRGGGIEVHVSRGWVGAYGAVVPTLVSQPPSGRRVVVSLRLRGSGKSPFEILVDEFPAGPDIIQTTVPATRRWHRYTFSAKVKGRWLGLGLYVGRSTKGAESRSFGVRALTVRLRKH
jgi:hypothetical protein